MNMNKGKTLKHQTRNDAHYFQKQNPNLLNSLHLPQFAKVNDFCH